MLPPQAQISPSLVWPDSGNFRHIGKIAKVFGDFMGVYLVFGQILNLLW